MSDLDFTDRVARIEHNRRLLLSEEMGDGSGNRGSGLGTLLLWAVFLALAWGAFTHPWLTFLVAVVCTPVAIPIIWIRRRRSPERQAVLDLLNFFNPFA